LCLISSLEIGGASDDMQLAEDVYSPQTSLFPTSQDKSHVLRHMV